MKRKILQKITAPVMIALVMVLSGCGGGSDGSSVQGYSVYGTVQRTGSASNSRVASAIGMTEWTLTDVDLYAIDESGAKSGDTILSVQTNSDGKYYMTMPVGISPSSSIVVSAGTGNALTRAIVTQSNTGIGPVSETVFRAVTASTSQLSYFEPAEVNQLLTLVSTSTQYMNFSAATSTLRVVEMIQASATVQAKLNANVTRLSATGNQYYSLQ